MRTTTAFTLLRSSWLLALSAPMLLPATSAFAQSADEAGVIEEVVVTGVRRTIQDSIQLKRGSVEIVDGLNADEIGALPALSIGEALETITGAATHRENGGATEVAIRGLGPYLGTTVVNGRESTNGSGNRAVNFSIFPSELFNGVSIHKTQSASYVEGAVSGQVQLDTRRPIDYGDQRVQFSLKGSAHPDDGDIMGQDNGYRATASYINSWEVEGLGTFGISIGGQSRDDSNPEAEATHTTGGGRFEACVLESFDAMAQPLDTSGRCDENGSNPDLSNDQLQDLIDSNPAYNSVEDIPYAYIPRDRTFRRNTTDDDRQALFGAFQWQPNESVDIMLDFQQSERDQKELRQDLQFGATQNNLRNVVSNPRTGLLQSFTTDTDIRSNTTDFSRFEEYEGAGLNIAWQATDNLEISFDAAFADTNRVETDVEVRMAANEVLITDPDRTSGREEFLVSFDVNAPGTDGLTLPTILCTDGSSSCDPNSLLDFDITNPAYFTARDRARIRARQQIRENTIDAYRMDLSWDTDESLGFIYNVQAGARSASLAYRTFGGNRNDDGFSLFEDEDFDGVPGGSSSTAESRAAVFNAANNCGQSSFPEPGFLSESRGGNDLVTVANGIGTGTGWATFDHGCLLDELTANYGGRSAIGFQNGIQTNSINLAEDTTALYVQANYESEMSGRPVRGNFGVRVVETKVESIGYRTPLTVSQEDGLFFVEQASGAEYEQILQSNSYTEVLPSLTFIMDINDDWVFRAGAFKGISRPDPHSYGNSRAINTNDSDDPDSGYATLAEAVQGIGAPGNPNLEPLPSWNLDVGVEWYANEDTLLAAGVYWKRFQGAFENAYQQEDFLIDGNTVAGTVRTTQVSDETSDLTGVEITATHAFDYLPGFLSGFGGKFSYNYADSDFEFEDGHGGDGTSFDTNGNPSRLLGLLPPAGLWGLSRHTSATQVYWQNDRFHVQAIYKARSQYFQGYGRDTGARIRYVDDYNTLDLRLRYDLSDSIELTAEGINLLSEPRIDFRALDGEFVQTLEYGPRIFVGARARF